MTCMERLASLFFRQVELTFAVIVAGVTGDYLHRSCDTPSELARFIYTETLAGISIFCALIWLFPFASTFMHWPLDILISACWFVSFGLIVDFTSDDCGRPFDWHNISFGKDQCGKFKADIAFAFLSALAWLLSGLIGFAWTHRHMVLKRRAEAAQAAHRGRWFRV